MVRKPLFLLISFRPGLPVGSEYMPRFGPAFYVHDSQTRSRLLQRITCLNGATYPPKTFLPLPSISRNSCGPYLMTCSPVSGLSPH